MRRPKGGRWAIILSGGEGRRLRSLVLEWVGHPIPKQYCSFIGSRSMLEQTIDRAKQLVSADRIVTVIGHGHRRFLNRSNPLPGTLIEQPENCDTLPGVFLPATYIRSVDPTATLIILPSDHFVAPEARFLDYVEEAVDLAERLTDRLVLLGVAADRPEIDYGWIEPYPWDGNVSGVAAYHEKPTRTAAERYYREGFLWNTMVVALRSELLWSLGYEHFPELIRKFDQLLRVLNAVRRRSVSSEHEEIAVNHIYRCMERLNFSKDFLERVPERTAVLKMSEVYWSDWGSPERIAESLTRLGVPLLAGIHS